MIKHNDSVILKYMNVIIYESSSFGGCYNYAIQLFKTYKKQPGIKCELILPKLSDFSGRGVKHILINDTKQKNRISKKMSFIYRSFINPLIFFVFLVKKEKSVVLMNDFEQISAPFWNIFYRIFLKKHLLSIFLHDPNRDNYPPSYAFANYSMRSVMKSVKIAFYHEILPAKPYYKGLDTKFVQVPHGVYPEGKPDGYLLNQLIQQKEKLGYLLAIIGNIRKEKNYELIINALAQLDNCGLVIAGKASNSDVNTDYYKKQAEKIGVQNRIIWIERYLSDEEMVSVIKASDCISLYYSGTFASQSAILNEIANYQKQVIISDTNSSLTQIAKRFKLGCLVETDNKEAFISAVRKMINKKTDNNWEAYRYYASWDTNVNIAIESYKKTLNE